MQTEEQRIANLRFFNTLAVPDEFGHTRAVRTMKDYEEHPANPYRAPGSRKTVENDAIQGPESGENVPGGIPTPGKPHRASRITLTINERDIAVKIHSDSTTAPPCLGTKRGKITGYSRASARRYRWVAHGVFHQMQGCGILTYPEGFTFDGRKVERDRRTLFKRFARLGIRVIYGKEFMKNGQLHMHFAVTKWVNMHWLARAWYEIVGSNNLDHYNAGTTIEWIRNKNNLGAYFGEYMGKQDQKVVPDGFRNVGRMWGYTRSLLDEVIIHFLADTKQKWNVVRIIRNWWRCKIRALYGVKWKRRNPALGFIAWDGRQVFEIMRAKTQPTTLTS
jgi:hypothetical protein